MLLLKKRCIKRFAFETLITALCGGNKLIDNIRYLLHVFTSYLFIAGPNHNTKKIRPLWVVNNSAIRMNGKTFIRLKVANAKLMSHLNFAQKRLGDPFGVVGLAQKPKKLV